MKTKVIYVLAAGLLVMTGMATSCSQDGPDNPDGKPAPRKEINLTEKTRAAADGLVDFYSRFTIDMAECASRAGISDNKNVVVSPLSAAMVFSMAANTSDENIIKEYCKYLGVDDIESLNELSKVLLEKLPVADNTSSFSLENSIWVNSGYNLKLTNEFSDIVTSKYLASTKHVDFSNTEATLKALNDWCASNTDNKITGHFKDVNPSTYAILLNSMYFKGKWSDDIFDSSRTKAAVFHGLDGDSSPLTMESDFTEGLYASDNAYECFTLSFGNKAFRLEIILPAENVTAENEGDRLTAERIANLRKMYAKASVKAFLPKFSAENSHNLNNMLSAMNLGGLTLPGLTMFTKPVTGGIQYNQSVSFTLNETGAEAATITSGSMDPIAPGPMEIQKITVKVDRPFYFFIREFSTDACIMSGRICNL